MLYYSKLFYKDLKPELGCLVWDTEEKTGRFFRSYHSLLFFGEDGDLVQDWLDGITKEVSDLSKEKRFDGKEFIQYYISSYHFVKPERKLTIDVLQDLVDKRYISK